MTKRIAAPKIISDYDLFLLGEGNHLELYNKLGAHPVDGGVHFAVWAPNAKSVKVIGDFNGWNGRKNPMSSLGNSGVWETFIPGLGPGALYKFEVRPKRGRAVEKADPMAFLSEVPPRSASVVWAPDSYNWSDAEWIKAREAKDPLAGPVNIYECHLGSWRRVPEEGGRTLTYREFAEQLIDYVKSMGYTHVEFMPVTEHPFGGSWGYQTTGYFAPTTRFGSPEDLMYLIDRAHREGIAVILDWVPSHFAIDEHGLGRFDGTALYEHEDPRKGFHPDWCSHIFNYGRNEVRNFLTASALYWLRTFHADGLRVDAVASMLYLDYSRKEGEWIPNCFGGRENLEAVEFLKSFNTLLHREFPGILTIAEESTAWPMVSRPVHLGGLGFSLKWNMGWMHDSLEYISREPIHRKYHHNQATFGMVYAFTENFVLVLSHDEVAHGKRSLLDKMPGDPWQKFANLRAYYGFMMGHPGKKLLFMGGEFGHGREWDHDQSLDWHLLEVSSHRGVRDFVSALNRLYRDEPALYQVDFDAWGFEWIDCNDSQNSVLSFIRYDLKRERPLIFVCNFTPEVREGYRIGVPHEGRYTEVLNSDAGRFGGGGVGNRGELWTEYYSWHGREHSLRITLPPLSVIVLRPGA